MTSNDPTDHALAVIASIFEKPARPEPKVTGDDAQEASSEARGRPDAPDHGAPAGDATEAAQPAASPEGEGRDAAAEVADTGATEAGNDEAEADGAIDGEIVDAVGRVTSVQIATTEIVEITMTQAPELPVTLREDGTEDLSALTRHGPGPLDALRFKWSVRQGDEGYYVDETIGTTSQPIVAGPFSRAEAIAFIDTRERRTRRRFERLRNEIISGPSERGDDDDDETL
ncbi:hypothetical protein [Rhodopseudomonas telluris]|uniref:Uncharacterized protein n=1 Tax=Rhodopseudomonas telluris TaxID=644215 RepID=A0ABV6EZF1_9BRAD